MKLFPSEEEESGQGHDAVVVVEEDFVVDAEAVVENMVVEMSLLHMGLEITA